MICASFDIGKKNFSFCVEYFKDKSPVKYKKKRYNIDGTCEEQIKEHVKQVCLNGDILFLTNVDITDNCDSKLSLDPETFYNMNDELDKHLDLWDKCDVFIIEKQMMFGKQTNPMAVKLAQHCYSYFVFKYGRFKKIIEFPAYNKTQVLGALKNKVKNKYKSIAKPQRKKWCINKAIEILEERKDNNTIQQILLSRKKDDLCDVICQLQSWKVLLLYI